jgi:hypothetical protein
MFKSQHHIVVREDEAHHFPCVEKPCGSRDFASCLPCLSAGRNHTPYAIFSSPAWAQTLADCHLVSCTEIGGRPGEWKAQDSQAVLVPGAAFDLVYLVNVISRSQPTPLALERFQSLR